MTSREPAPPTEERALAAPAVERPRTGLAAPLWIGLLTAAILAVIAFIARNSFAA